MRYQLFIESEEADGSGSVADCATIFECWNVLRGLFRGIENKRVWWIRDNETESFASGWECGQIFDARAGSLDDAKAYFSLCGLYC